MQQKRLHKTYHYLSSIKDEVYSEEALQRKKKLDDYQQLYQEGTCKGTILSVLEISRATYYRCGKRLLMNAFVKQGNGTVKYEFYSMYDHYDNLESINFHLNKYKHFYNTFRPHSGLQQLTPLEYYRSLEAK